MRPLTVITGILLTKRPDEVKLILIDPKMVEMTAFNTIPHLMCPIVTETTTAVQILEWATVKMDERYALLAEAKVKNVAEYNRLGAEEDFEIVTAPILSLFSFRYTPADAGTDLDALNLKLVNAINDDGRIYLTQTTHDGKLVIRFVAGQFDMEPHDIDVAFTAICEVARAL